jgi:arsenate reductase-like glutaredoxin family protein
MQQKKPEKTEFEELMEKFADKIRQNVPTSEKESKRFLNRMQNVGYATEAEIDEYMKRFKKKEIQ